MKHLILLTLTLFLSFTSPAFTVTVEIYEKVYEITSDGERPYIVFVDNVAYESYSLDDLIEVLQNL